MAKRIYWDASALAKRYTAEMGTPAVNYVFQQVAPDDMLCLTVGALEVISIFVRKKNSGVIAPAAFRQAMTDFRREVLDAPDVWKVSSTDVLVNAAIVLVEQHSLNATDAIILRSALDLAAQLRATGDDLVLVASDHRLLIAAQAESLLTFNPETQDAAALDALLGS